MTGSPYDTPDIHPITSWWHFDDTEYKLRYRRAKHRRCAKLRDAVMRKDALSRFPMLLSAVRNHLQPPRRNSKKPV